MAKRVFLFLFVIFVALPMIPAHAATLPAETPFWTNDDLKIDAATINGFAASYLAEAGPNANSLEFFLGYLPLKTVDRFCTTNPDKEQMRKYLGNMYISGLYGGIWLRDSMSSGSGSTGASDVMSAFMQMIPASLKSALMQSTNELIFKSVAGLSGKAVNLALTGSLLEIAQQNYASLDMFLLIYGYDYGYYFFLIDNPPGGIASPNPLQCNRFMDCKMTNFKLNTLTQYKPVVDKVYKNEYWKVWDPTALKYADMHTHMQVTGEGSVSLGNLAWQQITTAKNLSDASYGPLLDLSARFMLVSELALLPSMKGYCELNKTAGKCGLLQEAGLTVWLGSYMMGLSSDLPSGTFPTL